jgi:pyridoxamine 5'-phosphate oxidase
MDLQDIRKDYAWGALEEDNVDPDPMVQFTTWYEQYTTFDVPDSTAMIISTVGEDQIPRTRVVLLKEVYNGAFVFYTNYNSKKGKDILANNKVSLLFFWPEMERQIRVVGSAEMLSEEKSRAYFNMRPFESRVSAIISPQSEVVPNREYLENRFFRFLQDHPEDEPLDKPDYWGGIAIYPIEMEFWQGRISRLHDRLRYRKKGDAWKIERLAP